MKIIVLYLGLFSIISPFLMAEAPSTKHQTMGMVIHDSNMNTSIFSISNDMQLLADFNDNNGKLDFEFITSGSACHVSCWFSQNGQDCTFKGYFQDGGGKRHSSTYSSHDLANSNFIGLKNMNINQEFADIAIKKLKDLPKSTPNLSRIASVGLTIMDPVCSKNAMNIAGMFYASEYWGCVLGGGGWMECGDIARGKWGYN
ncbi:MAG: hypothetical protein HGA66_00350 [Holophaga sp.]|nr:hypothetical protein [Holophaga sp.]